ncbi:hypothetical protein E1295_06455 [Nonomuraea mesophila]|uniref:DUF3558 domain-containing protein n=1 Tax=Nonomuraea mesophila TaxID=2530382 RepID=A0A4R5FUP4_9ACTN|nr:hypothetical protein [Nonomuraea mesophila]TDE57919.1 hypothetical protein E1295_06455 [Nonomuraea mesophila]
MGLISLLMMAVACSPDNQVVHTPAPEPLPVADSAPYVCKLVPSQALRIVSGVTAPLEERIDGNERNGNCSAPDTASRSLEVWWAQESPGMSQEHLDFLIEGRRNVYTRHGGVTLPADLGDGMAAYLTNGLLAEHPYQVSARFTCGGKDRMVDIYLAQIAKGRDGIKDLIELMRIAQQRYSKVHDCKLAV